MSGTIPGHSRSNAEGRTDGVPCGQRTIRIAISRLTVPIRLRLGRYADCCKAARWPICSTTSSGSASEGPSRGPSSIHRRLDGKNRFDKHFVACRAVNRARRLADCRARSYLSADVGSRIDAPVLKGIPIARSQVRRPTVRRSRASHRDETGSTRLEHALECRQPKEQS
jgi:hypothetical protein